MPDADSYDVADNGDLVVYARGDIVKTFAAGTWVDVRAAGTPLAGTWPPDDLPVLLGMLARMGYCDISYYPERLNDPAANDLDALTDIVLVAEGFSLPSMTKAERKPVRDVIRRHFNVRCG